MDYGTKSRYKRTFSKKPCFPVLIVYACLMIAFHYQMLYSVRIVTQKPYLKEETEQVENSLHCTRPLILFVFNQYDHN